MFLQFSPVICPILPLDAINNWLLLFVSKHYPRKGTETLKASYSKAMQEDKAVSKHYPRKGTETLLLHERACFWSYQGRF